MTALVDVSLPDELLLLVFALTRPSLPRSFYASDPQDESKFTAAARALLTLAWVNARWRRLAKDRSLWNDLWVEPELALQFLLPHGFQGLFVCILHTELYTSDLFIVARHRAQITRLRANAVFDGAQPTDLYFADTVDVTDITWPLLSWVNNGVAGAEIEQQPTIPVHRLRHLTVGTTEWLPQWLPTLDVLVTLVIPPSEQLAWVAVDVPRLFAHLPASIETVVIEGPRVLRLRGRQYELEAFVAPPRPHLRKLVFSALTLTDASLKAIAILAPNLLDLQAHFTGVAPLPFPNLRYLFIFGSERFKFSRVTHHLHVLCSPFSIPSFKGAMASVHTVHFDWSRVHGDEARGILSRVFIAAGDRCVGATQEEPLVRTIVLENYDTELWGGEFRNGSWDAVESTRVYGPGNKWNMIFVRNGVDWSEHKRYLAYDPQFIPEV